MWLEGVIIIGDILFRQVNSEPILSVLFFFLPFLYLKYHLIYYFFWVRREDRVNIFLWHHWCCFMEFILLNWVEKYEVYGLEIGYSGLKFQLSNSSFVALGEVLTVIFHFILQMRIMGSNRMMPLILFQKISKGNRLIKQHGYYHWFPWEILSLINWLPVVTLVKKINHKWST